MNYQKKSKQELISLLISSEKTIKDLSSSVRISPGEYDYTDVQFELTNALKKIKCHNQIAALISNNSLSLDEIIAKIADIIIEACQYPNHTQVSILYNNTVFTTPNYKQSDTFISQNIVLYDVIIGNITVCYNQNSSHSQSFFLSDESDLLFSIANSLSLIIDRYIQNEKLKTNEYQFKTLVENINEILYEIDSEGIIKYVSPSINLMGYTPDEMIGRSFLDFTGDKAAILYTNLINIKAGVQVTNEYEMLAKNGTSHWLRFSTKGIYDENGAFAGGRGTLVDVTERKNAEEQLILSELRYKTFFETNNSTMIIVDPDTGKIKDANSAACKFYGWNKDELCSMNINQINTLNTSEIAILLQKSKHSEAKHLHFKHRLASGELRDVEVYSSPATFDNKTYIHAIIHDISDRVTIENNLRISEEKYRNIFETVQDAYYEASLDGVLMDISPAIYRISRGQYKREDIIGKSLLGFYSDPDARDNLLSALMTNGIVTDYEIALSNKDGAIIPVSISSIVVFDSQKKPVKITGSIRDIEDRKKNERMLQENEEKYRLLFANNPQPMWIYDLETLQILEVNNSSINQYGYSRDEFLKMTLKDIRPSEDIPELISDVNDNSPLKNFKRVWRHFRKNGELRYVQITAQSVDFNGRKARHVLINDITDQTKATMKLAQSEERFSQVVEQSKEVVWEVDSSGKYTYVSPIAKEVYGYMPEDMIDKMYFYDLFPSNEKEQLSKIAFELFENQKPIINFVNNAITSEGQSIILLTNGIPMLSETGKLIGYRGIDINITEQKRAENELIKFRTISDQANYGAFITSLDGKFEYVNAAFENIVGWKSEELLHRNFELLHNNDQLKRINEIERLIREKGGFAAEELSHCRKNGTVFPSLMSVKLIFDQNNTPLYLSGTLIDITERKLVENNLLKANRLKSLISNINQTIVHEKNKDKLLEKVCNIAVNTGQFRMAWVGLVDEINKKVIPYKINGIDEGYFSQIKPISIEDIPEGRGITGNALRMGKPFISNDIENDTNMKLWKDEALKRNYRSAISIPIKQLGNIYGALSLYSSIPNFFNTDEVRLLMDVVDNISYALDAIETENERSRAEQELRKLSQAIEQSPVSIVITNIEGNIEYANPKACESTGFSNHELYGKNPRILKSGNDSAHSVDYKLLWKTISTGNIWQGVFHNKKKTGELYWESSTISPITDSNGKITHYVSVKEDITEKIKAEQEIKKTEKLLIENEQRLNFAQAIANIGSWEVDYKNNTTKWSENEYRLLGLEPFEPVDKDDYFLSHIHPDDKELVQPLIENITPTSEIISNEFRFIMPDKSIKWLRTDLLMVIENDTVVGFKGTHSDITAVKQTEMTLKNNQSSLNFAQKIAKMGSWKIDVASQQVEWSENEYRLFGLEPYADVDIRTYFSENIHPDHKYLQQEVLQKILSEHTNTSNQFCFVMPDKSIKWIQGDVSPIIENNEIVALIGTHIDITDKVEKDLLLKDQNERLNAIVQAIPDLIFVLNKNGEYLEYYVNDLLRQTLVTDKIIGSNITDTFDLIQAKIHNDKIQECIITQNLVTYEYSIKNKGKTTYYESRLIPVGNEKILAFVRNISTKKEDEIKIQKLSLAVTQSPVSVLITNLKGEIEFVNPAFEVTTGYTFDMVKGKHTRILKSGQNNEDIYVDLWNTVTSGKVWITDWINKKRNGEYYWEHISISPVYDETGSIINYLAVKQDITERKRNEKEILDLNINLERKIAERTSELAESNLNLKKEIDEKIRSEQKFETAFHSSSALMAISEFDSGKYLDVNSTFIDTLGYSRDEIIGNTNQGLKLFVEKGKREEILQSLDNGIALRKIEVQIRTKIGQIKTVLLSADTIFIGNIRCLLTVSVEITDRKQAEEEIKKARLEAEKANVAKSEFLSRMSHELRTPMNSILGFAQILEMGELTTGQKKGVNHILKSGKHLLSLINEVLDISRIEAGRLSISIEPIKVSGILDEMIDVIRPMAHTRGITMEVTELSDTSIFVNSDRQSLKQVVLNLLNNAIKYNNENGMVSVLTQFVTDKNTKLKSVRISITDTGIGISNDDIYKLFTPFERIGAQKLGIEGTGLGLAVVKKLIETMNGTLGVESKPGEGSTFWIQLPAAENQLSALQNTEITTEIKPQNTFKKGTILYIEDNSSNIELVEQILLLQRPDIQLITNMDGRQAVVLATEYKPDLILLDLNLPDIHGSEVLALLQKTTQTKNIPVVVISADAMKQQIENLLAKGARTYLTKPIEVTDFLNVIDEFI